MDQLNLRTIPAMGFRFRKRIRILPGFRINLSKTGISTSQTTLVLIAAVVALMVLL
jgi:Protein of unknown function (DUF4236)